MANYIKTLKEDNGDVTYPVTKAGAVYLNSGTDAESKFADCVTAQEIAATSASTPMVGTNMISDKAVTSDKIDWTTMNVYDIGSYSTSEIQTGATWIDGSMIYKKTKAFLTNGSTMQTLSFDVITGMLVDIRVLVDADSWWAVATTSSNTSNVGIGTWVYRKTTGAIDFYQSVTLPSGCKIYVTIWYTK